MKEIRTIKMVEQTEVKFVAYDGKEFSGKDAEKNCVLYEAKTRNNEVKFEFSKLNAKQLDLPLVKWLNDEHDIWKIDLYSRADYFTMVSYFKIQHGGYFDCYVDEPKKYPCEMFVLDACDYISEYKGDLRSELANTLLEMF